MQGHGSSEGEGARVVGTQIERRVRFLRRGDVAASSFELRLEPAADISARRETSVSERDASR